MVFDVYRAFMLESDDTVARYGKPVAYKAFEHLLQMEIVKALDAASSRTTTPYHRPVKLILEVAQIIEVLDKFSGLPVHVKIWAKKNMGVY